MKLYTPVTCEKADRPLSLSDSVFMLGSCFADEIGRKMQAAGFDVCVNPFGTLYNASSIRSAMDRLDSDTLFTEDDCVEMGAGAGRICSFEHHSSFSRPSAGEFLQNANARLLEARGFWKKADAVILTLGTARIWCRDGRTVSNCLKRPSYEFTRRIMESEEIALALQEVMDRHPEKRFILTVSPVRHLGDGAHANSVSKARLLLAADMCRGAEYFPAFEILNDELRDYRFYADDLVHPSSSAIAVIWERFLETFAATEELDRIAANEKTARREAHRPVLR